LPNSEIGQQVGLSHSTLKLCLVDEVEFKTLVALNLSTHSPILPPPPFLCRRGLPSANTRLLDRLKPLTLVALALDSRSSSLGLTRRGLGGYPPPVSNTDGVCPIARLVGRSSCRTPHSSFALWIKSNLRPVTQNLFDYSPILPSPFLYRRGLPHSEIGRQVGQNRTSVNTRLLNRLKP